MSDPTEIGAAVPGSPAFPPLYTPFKAITPRLAAGLRDTTVSPNALTVGWGALLVAAAVSLAFGDAVLAALLVLCAVLLDCLDGDLARARGQSTVSGTLLEQIAHWIGNMALAAGVGAGLLLADPSPGAVLLVSTLAVAQATYIAVVRQVQYDSASIPEHPRLRRAFRAIVHVYWLLSPIELPLVAAFLAAGVNWASVLALTIALVLSSALIFVPHFLLIRAVDLRQQKPPGDGAESVPPPARALARMVLETHYPVVRWWTPGTPALPPEIVALLARPPMAADAPLVLSTCAEAAAALPQLFRTQGRVLIMGCSIATATEAVLFTACAPGERVLLAGTRGRVQRWKAAAEQMGLAVSHIEVEFGGRLEPDGLRAAMVDEPGFRLVLLPLSEAEDGSATDLSGLSPVLRASGSLVVVDAGLGLCADELRMDEWGVDIALSSSDSGLGGAPGLSLVALGPRALATFAGVDPAAGRGGTYLDLRRHLADATRPYEALPAPAVGALWLAVSMTLAAGLDALLSHRQQLAERFRLGCKRLAGLESLAARPSAACTAVALPPEVQLAEFQGRLFAGHAMVVASGSSPDGTTLRIGHHGWRSEAEIDEAVAAIAASVQTARGTDG